MQEKYNYERRLVNLPVKDRAEIEHVFREFIAFRRERSKRKTLQRDVACLNNWLEFLDHRDIQHMHQFGPGMVESFLEWRRKKNTVYGKPPSQRTLNLDMTALNRCLNWAAEKGLIQQNPFAGKMPLYKGKKAGLPRYLTVEEIAIIEEAAKADSRKTCLYEAFAILVRTGMRSGELCTMDIANVDFERNLIILRPEQTKNKRMRAVPFSGPVRGILQDLIEKARQAGRQHLIYTRTGHSQGGTLMHKKLRNLLNRLGERIKNTRDIHVHTLRRTFISHMIMQGVDPVKVMSWVGHQDWATIKRYLVLAPNYVSEGADVLPY